MLPGRVDVKYSVLPSSDQRGAVLSNAGAVMRRDGAAGDRLDPDFGVARVLVLEDGRDRERERIAVGRQRPAADAGDPVPVFGLEGAAARLRHDGRRTEQKDRAGTKQRGRHSSPRGVGEGDYRLTAEASQALWSSRSRASVVPAGRCYCGGSIGSIRHSDETTSAVALSWSLPVLPFP